jgi:phage terminase small subunit
MQSLKLTAKQQRFVDEYLIDLNATQAAIRAGYSKKNAEVIGHQQLKKTKISEEISKAVNRQQQRTQVTADRVVTELGRVALFDPRRLCNEDGSLKPLQDLDDDTAACVGNIEVITRPDGTVTHKIRAWDKNSALEKLGKYFALFTERSEKRVTLSYSDFLDRIADEKSGDLSDPGPEFTPADKCLWETPKLI